MPIKRMERPSPMEILTARVNELTISIRLLLDAKHTLPALIILYSAIDVFGSLLRPGTELETSGPYFKKWVEDYIIPHSRLNFTPEEIWAARCGLLHSHTASSKLSRRGVARQVHYYRTYGRKLSPRQEFAIKEILKQGKLFIDVDALSSIFEEGARRFQASIQGDQLLEKRVLHHSTSLFSQWTSSGDSSVAFVSNASKEKKQGESK